MRKYKLFLLFFTFLLFVNVNVKAKVYIPNETANFIVSLTDVYGNPIANATCYGYIFDPNMSLIKTLSLNYNSVAKVYSAKFTVPDTYGTYYQLAKCQFYQFGKYKTVYARSSFFVSRAFDVIEQRLRDIAENVSINVTTEITGNITEAVLNATEDIIGLLLALHSTPITTQYCVNDTLVIVKTASWTINNKVYNITKNETIKCEWGCDPKTNTCKPHIIVQYAWLIGFVVIMIILGFFGLYLR